ncbi:GLPGLI family protein [Owenweeksia hongkongensis]|uniref:GLPGLI family protein n=1 Tax=Owenweeksia hongkongensis TaxID=253245 RepID=UPI003A8D0C41
MKYILTLLFAGALGLSQAQNFQGIATYKTSTSLDLKMDSSAVSGDQQAMVMKMLNQYLQKEYTLTFSKTESIYKEVEQLEQGGFPGMDILGTVMGTGGVFYKQVKDSRETRQMEFFGKEFLIKDTLEALDWKLGKESKTIGSYTCFKATAETEVVEKSISTSADDEEIEEEEEKKIVTITAWYTPQIPVNQGPDEYWGLPGLIMEVNNGSTVILCSQVVLNPKEKVAIEEPKTGEEVTRKEFKEIATKKMEQMKEMYGGGGSRGGNSGIKIQIPD